MPLLLWPNGLLRSTARRADRVLAVVILSACMYLLVTRTGIKPSPGEIETPSFHRI